MIFKPLSMLHAIAGAPIRPAAKLVGYTLLRYADRIDGSANVRQDAIGRDTGLKPRAIRNALRDLEAVGLLRTTYVKGEGMHTRLATYALQAPASTCRSLTTRDRHADAAALVKGSGTQMPQPVPEAPAFNDKRLRHVGAGISEIKILREEDAPPARAVSKTPSLWDVGISLLSSAGRSEPAARSALGRWIRDYGEAAVASAVGIASAKRPAEPVAFIEGTLRSAGRRSSARAQEIPDHLPPVAGDPQ